MKTLNDFLKEKQLKKADINNLLKGVKDASGVSENLNFDFDKIGFDDDIGRTSFETKSEPIDFKYELSKFLVRILRHIDVNDNGAITLGYRLFVRSSKPEYTLDDLMEILNEGVAA